MAREKKTKQVEKDIKEKEKLTLEEKKEKDKEGDDDEFQRLKLDLEQTNQLIDRKIVDVNTQIRTAQSDQSQKEYEIKVLQLGREKDYEARHKLQKKIDEITQQLENENKLSLNEQNQRTKLRELEEINKIKMELQNIKQTCIAPLQERMEKYELELDEMVNDKSKCIVDIENEKESQVKLDSQIAEIEKKIHKRKIQNTLLNTENDLLDKKIEPIEKDNEKLRKVIHEFNRSIENMKLELDSLKRKLDLINEVKNFNFEEIQMISSTNQHVSESITNLMRSYQQIDQKSRSQVFKK